MKGIVSAMGMNVEGVLAAGTWSRWLGLYDGQGGGGTIGIFEIGREGDGTGISQLLWSDCGRYLCVVERGSDGVGVWDVRGTGKRLCWLAGRKARTNQRLAVDRIGKEIWSGGQDGCVRVWEDLGMKEGTSEASWGFKAHDGKLSRRVRNALWANQFDGDQMQYLLRVCIRRDQSWQRVPDNDIQRQLSLTEEISIRAPRMTFFRRRIQSRNRYPSRIKRSTIVSRFGRFSDKHTWLRS